jgi:hypothetical protein
LADPETLWAEVLDWPQFGLGLLVIEASLRPDRIQLPLMKTLICWRKMAKSLPLEVSGPTRLIGFGWEQQEERLN